MAQKALLDNQALLPAGSNSTDHESSQHDLSNSKTITAKSNAPPKRKFDPKAKTANNGKNKRAKFSKKPETAISTTRPLDTVFELATSFSGIKYIANVFYQILQSRDSKMTNLFTELEFAYIINLCVYYRCATVANLHKTAFFYKLSEIRTLVEGLLLPDCIATYVETFGVVEMSNGIKVIPYFRKPRDMYSALGYIDLAQVIRAINKKRLPDELPYSVDVPAWGASEEIVMKYSRACSRALKNAIELRPIDYKQVEGRPEFLSVFEDDGKHVKCLSLDKIDNKQCELGASYRLRTIETIEMEGVKFPVLFGTDSVRPDVCLQSHFIGALRT